MFRSLHAAEKAAIDGEGNEFDTQACLEIQKDLLPSSPSGPTDTPTHVTSTCGVTLAIKPASPRPSNIEPVVKVDTVGDRNVEVNGTGEAIVEKSNVQQPNVQQSGVDLIPQSGSTPNDHQAQPRLLKRNSAGKLRLFTADGHEYGTQQLPPVEQVRRRAEMDDLTQKSSMSLTQENPKSAYDHYDIQRFIQEDCPSTATPPHASDLRVAPHESKHASARTESTAYTYQENDTGHIQLDFHPEEYNEEEDNEPESQDASYAIPTREPSYPQSYDPKTPAPPVNPFRHKGSVMKGFELFGATQPSSVGRHMASPTSSRPSPDVYNDFSSPPQRVAVPSSPLGRLPEPELNESTPLQSSVRTILRSRSYPPRQSAQSSDTGPRTTPTQEPRAYVSMQESQEERRRKLLQPDPDSSDGDSDIEAAPSSRKREREKLIQKELAAVELRKRMPSRPSSSSAPAVEVPSTGRRPSLNDDYTAQCSSLYARDTQQDDVIVDSQGPEIADNPTVAITRASEDDVHEPTMPTTILPKTQHQEQNTESSKEMEEETEAEADADDAPATASGVLPEPSLPLQEVSPNRNDVRTPNASKMSDSLVPETSPLEERLRPMGEIASISFGERNDMMNLPGFTQDVEFDSAMHIVSSPMPPTTMRSSFRKESPRPVSPKPSASGSETDRDVPSSGLSSAPSVIQEVIMSGSASSAPTADAQALHGEGRKAANLSEDSPKSDEHSQVQDGDAPGDQTIVGQGLVEEDAMEESTIGNGSATPGLPNESAVPRQVSVEKEADSSRPTGLQGLAVGETDGAEEEDGARRAAAEEVAQANKPSRSSSPKPPVSKRGLRTKSQLKGPSKNLRRAVGIPSPLATPRQSSRSAKAAAIVQETPQPRADAPIAATSAVPPAEEAHQTPTQGRSDPGKRTTKRKSGATVVDEIPSRSSKRQSTARDISPDELTVSPSVLIGAARTSGIRLFDKMTFAVSYVGQDERDRNGATKLILDNGGRILADGFNSLFETNDHSELLLSATAKLMGFTALIADEHSRKAKYMQALALGLPCISGYWISACVAKDTIVDWSSYLLCAGQSSFLGNAHRSRLLQPYPAAEAKLDDVFSTRGGKLLEGKSVLLVTGKGKVQEKRKAYTFLTRALGPARLGQVIDHQEARKKLLEPGEEWDLLYVDTKEQEAEAAVFGSSAAVSSSASRKRKRGPTAVDDSPAPKKIRIISDETMIQSLILGQLLEG